MTLHCTLLIWHFIFVIQHLNILRYRQIICKIYETTFVLFFSEMFIETGKFSTRTLSAIKNLDGAVIRQKKRDPGDYQWRQDMEQ